MYFMALLLRGMRASDRRCREGVGAETRGSTSTLTKSSRQAMSISVGLLRHRGEGRHQGPLTPDTKEPAMTSTTRPDAPPTNRWAALLVLCAGVLMIVLDMT